MTPVERLLAKLPDARPTATGWSARCPAHDDRRASLSIAEGADGRALLKCFAGCTVEKICGAVGLRVADLMPTPSKPRIVSTYGYRDEAGNLLFQVVRFEPKDFRQRKPKADGGWDWTVKGVPIVPYRLQEFLVKPTWPVVVVEGEKDADNLARIGVLATCNAGGAGKWKAEHAEFLRGRRVVVVADNDEPGRKHAQQVARSLHGIAVSVRIVELPGLPPKGDASDWLAAGGTIEELKRLTKAAPDWTPAAAAQAEPIGGQVIVAPVEEFQPFPLEALPEPVRGFVVAAAKAIGCDQSYLALPLLVALAAAIGNARRVQLKRGWTVPAILWAAIVGESGTAKTPAIRLAMRPIKERQRKALEQHAEAMRQYDAELLLWKTAMAEDKKVADDPPEKPLEPQASRYIVSDTTVEALAPLLLMNPRGLLMARDELAGWIGSFDRYGGGKGGADAAHWLSMHSGESIIVDRKTGIPRTINVPFASVCVCGGIPPTIFHRALGTEHRESGLAARLLLTCPPRKAKRWTEADIDPAAEAEIARLVDRLYELQPATGDDGEPCPEVVGLTPKAKALWKIYFNAHAREQVDLAGDLSAAWSKLEEYAARLALVIHLARWAADDPTLESVDLVDETSMAAGIRLATWFKGEVRRVYAMLGESADDRDRRRLIEWIGRRGGTVAVRDVQAGCRWLQQSGAADTAVNELVQAGLGGWRNVPTTAKGGRPSRVFTLSTPSTISTTHKNSGKDVGSADVDNADEPQAVPPNDESPEQ